VLRLFLFGQENFLALQSLGPIQKNLNNIWKRAIRLEKRGDALLGHRTKKFIDEIVDFGTGGEGIKGNAERILKGYRKSIDTVLDTTFPIYDKANIQFTDTIKVMEDIAIVLGKKFKIGAKFADAEAGLGMRRILSNTKSRAGVLRLLDKAQVVLEKYGIKLDEDIITQANFADVLETLLGSEAPGSFLGQIEKGVTPFARAGGKFLQGKLISGTIQTAVGAVNVTRRISQENAIKALEALLKTIK